ncbi:hypothetical protein CK203_004698 [Vitis vinifera]|uniref:Uncharacterized protein n=1 Tax=Vitis vinifera TaxID=29760 RepID=A0A438KGN8_VITVI|nr:hypothetical protein CK203_083531 [Vitis vinifera]RVX20365.1 hypothetical protein CK203_004698 [Vitis vinifera]
MTEFRKADGYENTYTLVRNRRKKILRPIKEIPPHKQPKEKLAPLKLEEEPSNTLTKKQVKVTRNEEEIINDESRKQEVMELILDQPVEELKEIVEASEESILDFLRPNIIHGKETTKEKRKALLGISIDRGKSLKLEGIEIDPEKIKAIVDWPVRTNIHEGPLLRVKDRMDALNCAWTNFYFLEIGRGLIEGKALFKFKNMWRMGRGLW